MSDNNIKAAYAYAAAVLAGWYLTQLTRQTGFVKTNILAARIKSSLATLLYAKVSSLTSFTIKNSELGKITNLIASDLGVMDFFPLILYAAVFPISIIGSVVLLVMRVGWVGVIGIFIAMLTSPLSNCISKRNGALIKEINVHKDHRMQTTSEVIEGIKFIKLYGWELAFRKMVHRIRELEIILLKSFGLGRSVDKATGNSICLFGAFVMFIVAHHNGIDLTVARIFSSLEVIFAFKFAMEMMSTALQFYY